MLTVLSVLRSGGPYDETWVSKLKRGVARHLSVPHRFACLTDVPVADVDHCYKLEHDWPGWWSKIEIFRPGVVSGPTLYLDLDTVLVGSIDALADLPYDFAMMRNLMNAYMPGSAVMWFKEKAPHHVYQEFSESAEMWMRELKEGAHDSYRGDQAFIWECMHRKVDYFTDALPNIVRSYRRHCMAGIPSGCSVVAFGGSAKPNKTDAAWVKEAWA